jgi:hypothetical protein
MFIFYSSGKKTPEAPIIPHITGVVGAWSLRKLYPSATKMIRICRTSDNAETDVYFDSNNTISTSSSIEAGGTLGTWLGANNATVAKWYDQTTNGLDAIQATLSARPSIASGGAIITQNFLPSIQNTSGTMTSLDVPDNDLLDLNDELTFLMTYRQNTFPTVSSVIEKRNTSPFEGYHIFAINPNQPLMQWNGNNTGSDVNFGFINAIDILKTNVIRAKKNIDASCKFNLASSVTANFSNTSTNSSIHDQPLKFGGHVNNSDFRFRGFYSEIILSNVVISDTERNNYIDNAMAYYSIS